MVKIQCDVSYGAAPMPICPGVRLVSWCLKTALAWCAARTSSWMFNCGSSQLDGAWCAVRRVPRRVRACRTVGSSKTARLPHYFGVARLCLRSGMGVKDCVPDRTVDRTVMACTVMACQTMCCADLDCHDVYCHGVSRLCTAPIWHDCVRHGVSRPNMVCGSTSSWM